MKSINFNRLENLLSKPCSFVNENYLVPTSLKLGDKYSRAVRTIDGTLKTRTHNFVLVNNSIWYENNNSVEWIHKFATVEDACKWWMQFIKNQIAIK